MITLPVIIGLRDWADQVVLDLDNFAPIVRLEDETKWQEWAVQFTVNSGTSAKNPPNPYDFDDWRTWAQRFVQVME
jgi:hypothetical protein